MSNHCKRFIFNIYAQFPRDFLQRAAANWPVFTEKSERSLEIGIRIDLNTYGKATSYATEFWASEVRIDVGSNIIFIKHERQCFIIFPNTEKGDEIQRAAEYFWRNSRCLEMWWNTVSSVWYIFSIKTKTKE